MAGPVTTNSKLRDLNDITGTKGESLTEAAFPDHWVVRKLPKDYGIDFDVEVFNDKPSLDKPKQRVFETKGQHVYVQVKSTVKQDPVTTIGSRKVIVVSGIESALLKLVVSMGIGVPVILVRANVLTGELYWVCLNDYIDKILRPHKPKFLDQESNTIYIDTANELDPKADNFWLLEALSQRAKLFGAFFLLHHIHTSMSAWIAHWKAKSGPTHNLLPKDMRSDLGMIGFYGLLNELKSTDIWSPTEIGGFQMASIPELHAVLNATGVAVKALLDGSDDPNHVLIQQNSKLQRAGVSPIFRESSNSTDLSYFFDNLQIAIDFMSKTGFGYESGQRWMGLHKPRGTSS